MFNFTYYTPTKVVFGRDTESQTGSLVKELGGAYPLRRRQRGPLRASGPG